MGKKVEKPKQDHHYYATTAFGWHTADTREEAIAGCARYAGTDLIKRNVKSNGGLFVWSCRVDLPHEATYTITGYVPDMITKDGKPTDKKVPVSVIVEGRIQNTKGHLVFKEPDQPKELHE